MAIRIQILVKGIVQGVGFRPFVYSLAVREGINGRVLNTSDGVLIDVEGHSDSVERLVAMIKTDAPALARVESIRCSDQLERADYQDFRIVESSFDGDRLVPVSPDIATCKDCLRELFDREDRRYRYPFINCTNCGPRFSIIFDIPYDRDRTTMCDFSMCAACRAEYEDPLDRRFHSEPTACPACGPKLSLMDPQQRPIALDSAADEHTVEEVRELLSNGKIIAVKGVGGFHFACEALNAEAVERLRLRKYREDKPFALMANSAEVVSQYCFVSDEEKKLLESAQRPIVLLERKNHTSVPDAVAPRVNTLGFMLPYSPIHHLLLDGRDCPLVLTSGNVSDEPICYQDGEAFERLREIADYFLVHDRRIRTRVDDSVLRIANNREMFLRRSRGFAPLPIKTGFKFAREILACGAELKNTFCLTRDDYAFMSHHIGDLENLETLASFTQGIEHFKRLFCLEPTAVAFDLHPEYLSTKYALSLEQIETKIGVQHHHAHVASCMVDNQIEGDVIGVAFDGLGFGVDGCMWGGEFFVANFTEAQRFAHLEYLPMPGGTKAIREPWRMAAVYLQQVFGDDFLGLDLPFVQELDVKKWLALRKMSATGTNSPRTSSVGRLFDAVSSLLRVRDFTNYEGQAAIELEQIANVRCEGSYRFQIDEDNLIRSQRVIRSIVEDLLDHVPLQTISARFHQSVAKMIALVVTKIRDQTRLNRVVLSGGVFQNVLLLNTACEFLSAARFEVFTHNQVPANDGGISLGQAAVANAIIVRS